MELHTLSESFLAVTPESLYTTRRKVFLDSTRVISTVGFRLISEELLTISLAHNGTTLNRYTPVGFLHRIRVELAYHSSIKTRYLRANGDSHILSRMMAKTLSIRQMDSSRIR